MSTSATASNTTTTLSEDDWKKVSKLVDQFYNRPDAEPFREPVNWKALGLYDYPKIVTEPMDLGTVKKKLQGKNYKTLHQVGLDVRRIWSNCQDYNQEGSDFHKLAGSLRKKWDDKFSKLVAESRLLQSSNSNSNALAAGATTANTLTTTGNNIKGEDKTAGANTNANSTKPSGAGALNEGAPLSSLETNGAANASANVSAGISTLAERKAFAKSLFSLSKEDLGRLLVEIEAKCPSALTRNAAEDEVELNVDKLSSALLTELNHLVSTATTTTTTTSSSTSSKPTKATSASQGSNSGGGSHKKSGNSSGGGSGSGGAGTQSHKRAKTSKAAAAS